MRTSQAQMDRVKRHSKAKCVSTHPPSPPNTLQCKWGFPLPALQHKGPSDQCSDQHGLSHRGRQEQTRTAHSDMHCGVVNGKCLLTTHALPHSVYSTAEGDKAHRLRGKDPSSAKLPSSSAKQEKQAHLPHKINIWKPTFTTITFVWSQLLSTIMQTTAI